MFGIPEFSLGVKKVSKISNKRLFLPFLKDNRQKRSNSYRFLFLLAVMAVSVDGCLVFRFVKVSLSTVFQKVFQDP